MPEFVDQIIVVDNGSLRRTGEVAQSFGATVIREGCGDTDSHSAA